MILKRAVLFALTLCVTAGLTGRFGGAALTKAQREQEASPSVRLGDRLFRDDRFSTPDGDLPASCSHCHLYDEDPQGMRAYADFFNRSWVSFRLQDQRRLELRNSPSILDAAQMSRLHYDGEFASLEDLVKGTLLGRPMGWLKGEERKALGHLRTVLLDDAGEGARAEGTYRDQFRRAFGVNLDALSSDQMADLVGRAISDFLRTLTTRKDSAYDRFIELNGLESRPEPGESGQVFGRRLLARISVLESRRALRLPKDFSADALHGLKAFFRTEGDAGVGNCVACHLPPLFTDSSFHNVGISQREYDLLHGEGKFASLVIPSSGGAVRPSVQFREIPSKENPRLADLGFWNFVDLKSSQLRRPRESDDAFLQRMIGTFKTPPLRNLKYTQPYFHDGSVHTLEDVIAQMIRLSEMARAGRIREADDELSRVRLSTPDIVPIAAFMSALNEDLKSGH